MLVGFAYLLGMLTAMELRHLRYYVVVAETLNITKAAQRLHVSQPPLSRQIRDLEEEVGVRLLERGARRLALTAAGRSLLRDARKILALADEAMQRARQAARQRGGELRVGYAPTPTAELLPVALELFQTAEPMGHAVLLDLATDEMIAAVEAKTLDVALIVRPLGARWDRLEFRGLFEFPVGVIVPARHQLAKKSSITLDEAFVEPVVAYIRKGYSDYHSWLNAVLQRVTVKPRVRATADGSASLVAAVVARQGIAFGPPSFETSFGRRIKYVRLSTPVPRLEVGILRRKEKASPLLSSFLHALEAAAKKQGRGKKEE